MLPLPPTQHTAKIDSTVCETDAHGTHDTTMAHVQIIKLKIENCEIRIDVCLRNSFKSVFNIMTNLQMKSNSLHTHIHQQHIRLSYVLCHLQTASVESERSGGNRCECIDAVVGV